VRHFCPRYEALLREAQGLGPEHDPYGDVPTEDLERGPQFAIHAKTLVVDGRVSLVCSHNFDPRSQALNTEAGVVIWSEDVAGELEQELRLLTSARNAWCVALKERVPVWSPINDFFTSISRALPILDVWPFRDYSNYDLREGCEPVPTDDARFREHYQAVGQFPGVSAGWKRFQTRLYSAFGGFLEGLL
jgi:phosphatidylserine/phosphatidylglycerophosphate/cardiolipin synthase-like enzyme